MPIHLKCSEQWLYLTGQTFPHKESIKALGGRFNRDPDGTATWILPNTPENLIKSEKLVAATGGVSLNNPVPSAKNKAPALENGNSASPPIVSAAQAASLIDNQLLEENEDPLPFDSSNSSSGSPSNSSGPDTFTVSQLLRRISHVIDRAFTSAVWVSGEVQNLSKRQSGLFFSIAEGSGQNMATQTINCVLWHSSVRQLSPQARKAVKEFLAEGMQIRLHCKVNFYAERSSVNLQVLDIDPDFSLGDLAQKRQKILKELRSKGMDQWNKRRDMSRFPFRIGLITAKDSRAYGDFCHQLHTGGFPGQIEFVSCSMQGQAVEAQVSAAIAKLQKQSVNIIVLTRGGGSAADLRWFDEPKIAEAIAHCTVPVICAIGHHDDVCIAEEICYIRQKTPTAAAQFILDIFLNTRAAISKEASQIFHLAMDKHKSHLIQAKMQKQRLWQAARSMFIAKRQSQRILLNELAIHSKNLIKENQNRCTQLQKNLWMAALSCHRYHTETNRDIISGLLTKATNLLQRNLKRIHALELHITSKNPMPWIKAGWTQLLEFTSGDKPRTVKSIEKLKIGTKLKALFADGEIDLNVSAIHGKKKTRQRNNGEKPSETP